jgi:putative ABC transport system permease protein
MLRIRILFRNIFNRKTVERNLDDEIKSYLGHLIDEKTAQGTSQTHARRQAMMEMGGSDQLKERVRDKRTGSILEMILQDLRYAARGLRKNPSFTTIAMLTLALGIGANTAVFSVVNAVLLKPLPYADVNQVVALWEKRPQENQVRVTVSVPDFLDWREQAKTLESLALYDSNRVTISDGTNAERVPAAQVSAGFFETLHIQLRMGRTFQASEENEASGKVAILTYGTWQQRFGGDMAVLEKSITLNGAPFRIVGVLPETFRYPFASACEVVIPVWLTPPLRRFRGIHPFYAIARIRDDSSIELARAEMDVISKQLEQQHPDTNSGHAANLLPFRDELVRNLKPALLVLLTAVAMVILIACANVANLQLARASVRVRETAVRAALGCSRSRLILQSFVESALLAILGAVAGVLFAWGGLSLLKATFFNRLEFFSTAGLDSVAIDGKVLAFTLGCAVISTLLFGVSPALAGARVDLCEALRTGRARSAARGGSVRNTLMVLQVALSVVLLTGAALLTQSFLKLTHVDPGFRVEHVLTGAISLPNAQYRNLEQATSFYDSLIDRVRALPGVRMAGVTDILPLSGNDNRAGIRIEGRQSKPGEHLRMHPRLVSSDYLQTMGIRLLQGRMFTEADSVAPRPVAVLSERAARLWQDGNPIGRRFAFTIDEAPWIEVIGVVDGVHNRALDADSTPDVYLPYRENPFRSVVPTAVTLALRTDLDEGILAPSLRETILAMDRSVALSEVRSMESRISDSIAPKRFNMILLAIFALLALALAASGLYGVLSYLVSQRTSEIGIRMALGASRQNVLSMVLRRGLALTSAGILAGIAVSFLAARTISSLLFGIQPFDLLTFASIPIFLIAVALVASYVPARRATRVDPLAALRTD